MKKNDFLSHYTDRRRLNEYYDSITYRLFDLPIEERTKNSILTKVRFSSEQIKKFKNQIHSKINSVREAAEKKISKEKEKIENLFILINHTYGTYSHYTEKVQEISKKIQQNETMLLGFSAAFTGVIALNAANQQLKIRLEAEEEKLINFLTKSIEESIESLSKYETPPLDEIELDELEGEVEMFTTQNKIILNKYLPWEETCRCSVRNLWIGIENSFYKSDFANQYKATKDKSAYSIYSSKSSTLKKIKQIYSYMKKSQISPIDAFIQIQETLRKTILGCKTPALKNKKDFYMSEFEAFSEMIIDFTQPLLDSINNFEELLNAIAAKHPTASHMKEMQAVFKQFHKTTQDQPMLHDLLSIHAKLLAIQDHALKHPPLFSFKGFRTRHTDVEKFYKEVSTRLAFDLRKTTRNTSVYYLNRMSGILEETDIKKSRTLTSTRKLMDRALADKIDPEYAFIEAKRINQMAYEHHTKGKREEKEEEKKSFNFFKLFKPRGHDQSIIRTFELIKGTKRDFINSQSLDNIKGITC